jgi:hypothetical protein
MAVTSAIGIPEGVALCQDSLPEGETILERLGPLGGTGALEFVDATTRRSGVGVNVERPQRRARTNDVDAGEQRRMVRDEVDAFLRPGQELLRREREHGSRLQSSSERGVAGRASAAGHPSVMRDDMERCGHSQLGSSSYGDRAVAGGHADHELAAGRARTSHAASSASARQRISPSRRP